MNDRMEGRGVYRFPDGAVYTGRMKDDAFNGTGVFTWPDGRVYQGPFRNGSPHGKGVLTRPDGKRENVEFVMGELVEVPRAQGAP